MNKGRNLDNPYSLVKINPTISRSVVYVPFIYETEFWKGGSR
jgi:hypothetical protein